MKLSTISTKLLFNHTFMIILASMMLTACGGGASSSPFATAPMVTATNSDGSFSATSKSQVQNKLSLSWTYESNIPDIAGFKVNDADNNELCSTGVPDDRFLSCDFTFIETGDQIFTITAYDINNNVSAPSAPIMANKAPQAVLQLDGLDNIVALDASQSSDFDSGSIVEYTWDFGDGNTYSGESIIHEYQSGTYTINLTVKDDQDATATTAISLTIAA